MGSQAPANADDDINTLGVSIVSGLWSQKQHADNTYTELLKIQEQLLKYDYYYQFFIYPNYKLTFATRNQSPKLDDFLRRFVGVTESSFLAINTTIRHRGQNGATELMSDMPVIIVGRGITNNAGAEGNGCFFDQALSNFTPKIRYSGAEDG
jgi:hypothetical protein